MMAQSISRSGGAYRHGVGRLMPRLVILAATALLGLAAAATTAHASAQEYALEHATFSLSTLAAGAHPDFETDIGVNQNPNSTPNLFGLKESYALTKGIVVNMPAGLVGNTTAVEHCSAEQLDVTKTCPNGSQVGISTVYGYELQQVLIEPVYLMEPPGGEVVARLGFIAGSYPTLIDVAPNPARNYALTATVADAAPRAELIRATTTIWGVPSSPTHDTERLTPEEALLGGTSSLPRPPGGPGVPFLDNPTNCGTAQEASISVDSWELPELFSTIASEVGPFTGCDRIPFSPQAALTLSSKAAGSPSGVDFALRIPQEGLEQPNGVPSSTLKKAVVTLPEGVTLNPSSAQGLTGCSEGQIGLESSFPVVFDAAAPACPESSKIGTVSVTTPLLAKPLGGALYVATQYANPTHSLVAGYLVIEGQGVLVKLAGKFALDPSTGRITASFEESPQLPFSEMHLHFTGGQRGVVTTPTSCGIYPTQIALTPWSAPSSPVEAGGAMTIDEGCSTGGFAPTFAAGTESNQAAAFSPFVLAFSRSDAESQITGLSFTMPPGATAKLAGVPLCSESEANAGTCPGASQIGTVTVASGSGSPISLTGRVYLTGPYNGGPFGEAVVVPANAGPFELGNVVVRGSIRINPTTAQASVVSDAFPRFVGQTGIPTDVRSVRVDLDRAGFTLNPTSCNEMAVAGTLTSTTGQSAPVSQRFQAAGCASLPFAPKFTAATSSKTSRLNGTSFKVKIAFPHPAPSQGAESNIAKVHVELPKALPSRLTTLQRACTEQQFGQNPAGCPAESVVGHAVVHTPILPVALEGPVYFVSHGGAAFPGLTMVLQGDGVTIELDGETFIDSKTEVTSSTFPDVPDAPVESFELTLPAERYSALAGLGDLCQQKLVMPTSFVAQNGATLKQNTKIEVEGCSSAISLVSKTIKGKTLTLKVSVPSSGKLTAGGSGLSSAAKSAGGRETVAVKLDVKLTQAQKVLLRRHPGRRLVTHVTLRFTPSKGRRLVKTVSAVV
jgi:hypothetical protein